MPELMGVIEGGVAVALTLAFVLSALFMYKPEHYAPSRARVLVGAGIQGALVGALIGFVIVPLRFAVMNPEPALIPNPPAAGPAASMTVLPALLLLIVIRRGLLARAPLIGRYLRAYRRASLKYQIEHAGKALARLEAMDEKAAI